MLPPLLPGITMQKDSCQSNTLWLLQSPHIGSFVGISFQGGCQQIEGLPAVFLEGLPASHLMAASLAGVKMHGLRRISYP
jgi:hypothetical protein